MVPPRLRTPCWKGPGADSEEKREPASDINTCAVDSLKVLDPERPIREADVSTRSKQLLDYFVSEQLQRVGYLNAKRFGRLLVDDEFEFGGLHDGKVGGLRALEDLTGVEADLMRSERNIDPIAH